MSLSREKWESPVGTGREREGEECSSMSGCLNQKTNKEFVLRGYRTVVAARMGLKRNGRWFGARSESLFTVRDYVA